MAVPPSLPIAQTRLGRMLLAVAFVALATFSARGITDEAALALHGDVSRHMMNGVFLWDLLRSGAWLSVDDAMTFAREYFVRYPALSIGHHPPLLAILLVPFYAVLGISAFSARLAILVCLAVACLALYSLARRLYGETVAGWASLLFASHPFIVPFGQQVMTEAPLLATVLLATDTLVRFCDSQRTGHYARFVVVAAASLYAKQLAVFMFPLYATTIVSRVPWRRLVRPDVLLLTAVGAVLSLPIVIATFVLSPHNVAVVAEATASGVGIASARTTILPALFNTQLSAPLLAAMVAALVLALWRRDRRVLFVAGWIVAVVVSVVLLIGPYETARYTILAVPAYCLCAATLASTERPPALGAITAVLLAAVVGWQVWTIRGIRPVGAHGYEAAARYVIDHGPSPTVLYSASVDTGYFVFFVRKHDPDARQIVLRSDKILTTSMMGDLSHERRIHSPDEIRPLLKQFGTRYVVIEDQETDSEVINWLHEELRSDRFALRATFPIDSRDRRLVGVNLAVYEYLDAGPPDPGAEIDVGIPVIGRGIRMPLSQLLPPGMP